MALILNIETATKVCSVALAKDGVLLELQEEKEAYSHSEKLTVFIQEVLKKGKVALEQLDAVAISKGPGSYTGLRIGTSVVKGLCYALDIPMLALPTLKAMCLSPALSFAKEKNMLLCPMIDARRMEVYTAFYDKHLNEIRETQADIIAASSYADILSHHPICFFGDGIDKCKDLLSSHTNAFFVDNLLPSALHLLFLAEEAYNKQLFENVAYFEPFYLKEFVAKHKTPIIP